MKNILIGFGMATCMFLIIGATDEEEPMEMFVDGQVTVECEVSENSRYQISTTMNATTTYETIIDTRTGEVISREWGHYYDMK